MYPFEQDADTQRVMLRLSKEYPGDLGILMPLMLNLLQLKPGLAFFMTVDEPHAYLRGDILEARYSLSCYRGLLMVLRGLFSKALRNGSEAKQAYCKYLIIPRVTRLL